MKTSKAGIAVLSSSEGKKLKSYKDSGGTWTIGRGITEGVYEGMTITSEQEEIMFAATLAPRERAVNRLVKVPITQAQFDALVSLVYNIGEGAFATSTLLSMLNASEYLVAADQFLRWDKIKGKQSPGLQNRRRRERAMFLRGVDTSVDTPSMPPLDPIAPDLVIEKPSLLAVIIKLITSWFAK